jgi:hypothetical protein
VNEKSASPDAGIQEAPDPLWRYIEMDRFETPAAPTKLPDRREILRLWRWLRPGGESSDSDSGNESPNPLPRLSRRLLDHLAPEPDRNAAAAALEEALAPRLDDPESAGLPVLVLGAPRSDTPRILEIWAEARGRPAVAPPEPERILARDEEWPAALKDRDRPWVLPRLEKCWLRHADGLWPIQRLLDMFANGEAGNCVIGCDSWAWEFFARIPPGVAGLPRPRIARAWDADRLARWLGPLAASAGVAIREADDGKLVLPGSNSGDSSEESEESGDFLRHLAAFGRGIPAVVRALWLRALESGGETPPGESGPPTVSALREIRIPSWKRLRLPGPPEDARRHAIVLHTLLLHDGLPSSLLPRLLPLSPAEIAGSLHRLRAAELVERENGYWRVSAVGYPAARKLLRGEGYLADLDGK